MPRSLSMGSLTNRDPADYGSPRPWCVRECKCVGLDELFLAIISPEATQ